MFVCIWLSSVVTALGNPQFASYPLSMSVCLLVAVARRVAVLDLVRRQIAVRFGFIVPMLQTSVRPLERCECITIRLGALAPPTDPSSAQPTSGGADRTYEVVAYRLGHGDCLWQSTNYLEARSAAEQVAKLMGVGVMDEVMGCGYREAGTLAESHVARIRRQAALAPVPGIRTSLSAEYADGNLLIELPRATIRPQPIPRNFLWWCCGGVMYAFITVLTLLQPGLGGPFAPEAPWWVDLAREAWPILVASVFFACVVLPKLVRTETQVRVRAGTWGLQVDTRALFGTRSRRINATDLRSVNVARAAIPPSPPHNDTEAVVAISDTQLLTFGVGCTRAEREWLALAVQHALVGHGVIAQRRRSTS